MMRDKDLLLVIDVQRDFCPGGSKAGKVELRNVTAPNDSRFDFHSFRMMTMDAESDAGVQWICS